jgi:polycomb protein EED
VSCVSVRWYNDLIISHAARESTIQLWRIDNFSSDRAPPGPAPIPRSTAVNSHTRVTVPASSIQSTRSAWGGHFQRLVQFRLPDHVGFYLRFGLFHELGAHPILIAGNEKSKIFIWDLQRLEELGIGDTADSKTKMGLLLPRHIRDGSSSSTNSGTSTAQSTGPVPVLPSAKGKRAKPKTTRGIRDPFHSVQVHKEIMVPKYNFAFRQFAWSRDGQWCVGVGDYSLINVLHRWEHGVPPPETNVERKREDGEGAMADVR